MITLNINGKNYNVYSDTKTPLLWVLRDELGLTGTKYGCGVEICSACTVWIDGSAEKSCDEEVGSCVGKKITTIEGLAATGTTPDPNNPNHPVQLAWIAAQVPQCGYCQSGMIMRVAKLLKSYAKPTDAQIDAALSNICACGTYPRVRAAIKQMTGQVA
jgi:isoquinoline 1-oxidoreductase alpha subunit